MKVVVFVSFVGFFAKINGNDVLSGEEKNAKAIEDRTKKEDDEFLPLEDYKGFDYDDYSDDQTIKASTLNGTNFVERKYKCVSDNKVYCTIVKVVLKQTFTGKTNFNCTQQDCSASIYRYIVYDQDWNKHKMVVNFQTYPSIEIYNNGEDTLYHCGSVLSGPCKGGIACETVHSPNPNPTACQTSPGVTRLNTDFAFLNIKNCGGDYIACSGGGYQTFTPGLMS